MVWAYLAAFGCALCYGVASVLQDVAARREKAGDKLDAKGLLRVTTQLPYLAGLALDGIGWVLSLIALQQLPLFAVQAIAASSIGVTVLLAAIVLDARPTSRQLWAIAVLGVGLLALALTAAPDDPRKVGSSFVIGVWVAVGVVAAMGAVAPRLARGDRAAALLGAISGLAYGGTAVCARALETDETVVGVLTDPLTWALIPFGLMGIGLFAAALQRGSVAVATATQFATEAVLPSLAGLLFLGDRAREGLAPVASAGFLLTVGAAVALALVSPAEDEAPTVQPAPAT
jgi:hypothetical protein